MSLDNGERQVAPDVDGIRRDHVARYEWAIRQLAPGSRVLDLACGVGYGAWMLAKAGYKVVAADRSREAIEYANAHFGHSSIQYMVVEAEDIQPREDGFDAVICFETIEHLADPLPVLKKFRTMAPRLYASVPNESVFPYRGYTFHHRHYTRDQFSDLLARAGWGNAEWHGQAGKESDVEPAVEGRTLIGIFERVEMRENAPEHVSIIGLGPSMAVFSELTKRLGGNSAYCDEVWGINAVGDVLACDRVFHMDDVLIQESRARLNPGGNIAAMLRWMKRHPGPIYTSVVREGYPGLVAFPLEEVLNSKYDTNGGAPYFNSTAAYAVAFAIHIGVRRISLFGLDYTLPNAHSAEQGRACVEFWLGIAAARGIEISVPVQTTLLDACADERERLYGYDCVNVHLVDGEDGRLAVRFSNRETVPTAEEIERRYDHKRHPNRIVAQEMEAAE